MSSLLASLTSSLKSCLFKVVSLDIKEERAEGEQRDEKQKNVVEEDEQMKEVDAQEEDERPGGLVVQ